jgi:hypothetical protein
MNVVYVLTGDGDILSRGAEGPEFFTDFQVKDSGEVILSEDVVKKIVAEYTKGEV